MLNFIKLSAVLRDLEEKGVRNWKVKARNRAQWRHLMNMEHKPNFRVSRTD